MKYILEANNIISNKIKVDSRWNYLPLLGSKSIIKVQYPEVPYVPMCFNLSISNCSLTLRWESWEQLFLKVFFFDFSKKGFFKGYFDFFLIESGNPQKNCSIINHSKVYRVEKVEKFLLYLSKKSIFISDVKKLAKSARPCLRRFGPGRPGISQAWKKIFICLIFLMFYLNVCLPVWKLLIDLFKTKYSLKG